MKDLIRTVRLLFLHVAISVPAVAAGWTAVEQPDLAEQIQNAKPLTFEKSDVIPVRSIRVAGPMWVTNPDGKTYDFIQIYYGQNLRNNWIVVVDLGSGEVKVTKQPKYMNWHNCWGRSAVIAPNGKLYVSVQGPVKVDGKTVYSHLLNEYDPATNEMKLRAFDIPPTVVGETHPLVLGGDGKLYMIGGHPTKATTAVQVDPETGKVTDYGPIGPSHAPNGVWGYFGAADDRYIYIGSGKIPWYLLAYDRQTGQTNTLLTTGTVKAIVGIWETRKDKHRVFNVRATNVVDGVRTGEKVWGWLKDGKLLPRKSGKDTPPPEALYPDPHPTLPPKPEVYLGNAAPTSEGHASLWFRSAEAKAAAAKDAPPDTPPEQLGWREYRYQIEPHPQFIYRLTELPDGRLFGSAGAYEGNFIYDPKTGKAEHFGKIHLSHYATAIHDNKVYMSGYPTSPLFVYDLSQPWNAGLIGAGKPGVSQVNEKSPESNPRLVTRLHESGAHKMYAAAVGADGWIYFGGRWYRNGSGGGLGWWDPAAQKGGGLWKPFSNYQVTHITAGAGGRYIVISTRPVRDAVLNKPRPETGRLFVYDTASHAIARTVDPVDRAPAGLVVGVDGARVLGFTQDPTEKGRSILYGVDAETGEVAFRKAIPFPLGVKIGSNQKERFDYRLGPDGKVWTFIDGVLVRIHPEDARVEVMGDTRFKNWHDPRSPGCMAFVGRDLWLGGYFYPRCLRGIVPAE